MLRRVKFTIFLFCFSCSVYGQSDSEQQLKNFVIETVKALAGQNYEKVSENFHYPPSYSKEHILKDTCSVKHTIMDMVNQFGLPARIRSLKGINRYNLYGTGGGDLEYWKNHTDFYSLTFHTNFTVVGEGVMALQVVNLAGKLELKFLSFGLYINNEQDLNKMSSIQKLLDTNGDKRDADKVCEQTQS